MGRFFARILLLGLVLVAVFFAVNYLVASRPPQTPVGATGTSGRIDTEGARQRGAELASKAAQLANKVDEVVTDAALTAKIKSKMTLDDTVKARNIEVDTQNGVVTLRGYVYSEAERQRASQLARETRGIVRVVDKLELRSP